MNQELCAVKTVFFWFNLTEYAAFDFGHLIPRGPIRVCLCTRFWIGEYWVSCEVSLSAHALDVRPPRHYLGSRYPLSQCWYPLDLRAPNHHDRQALYNRMSKAQLANCCAQKLTLSATFPSQGPGRLPFACGGAGAHSSDGLGGGSPSREIIA